MNRVENLSALKDIVFKLRQKIDERLGRKYDVKVTGADDEGNSKVIFTLNTIEYNMNSDRRSMIEDYLTKELNDFIANVKKEFKTTTKGTLSLKHKDTNVEANAVNYAGQYEVCIIAVYDVKLVDEGSFDSDMKSKKK